MTKIEQMNQAKAEILLSKRMRFDGVIMTIREFVEKAVSENKTIKVGEQNRIKEMTRTQFNRATGYEQAEHERKIAEGGKVKYYLIDGYEMTKTAYDYAIKISN